MTSGNTAAMEAYYALGGERSRLDSPFGVVEFLRTQEILRRALPPAPAVVADIGGGPGRYAVWPAGSGYSVEHRDVVPAHVDELLARAPGGVRARTATRETWTSRMPVDAVLLLGPRYHLTERGDRLTALAEAARVVKPGGPVFEAAISRWAPRLHGLVAQRLYEPYPAMRELVDRAERDGRLDPVQAGTFTCYAHRPDELRDEVLGAQAASTAAGCQGSGLPDTVSEWRVQVGRAAGGPGLSSIAISTRS